MWAHPFSNHHAQYFGVSAADGGSKTKEGEAVGEWELLHESHTGGESGGRMVFLPLVTHSSTPSWASSPSQGYDIQRENLPPPPQ